MCKILIVDNDKKSRKQVTTILNELFPEHEIISTGITSEASKMVQDLRNVDIVIFNSLKRNKPNGLQFATEVRENNPYTMLIYMTANLHKKTKLKALCEVGLDAFINKPVTKKVLELTIINSVARHRSLLNGKTPIHAELAEAVDNMIYRLNKKVGEITKESKGFFTKIFRGKKNERANRTYQ